MDITSGCCGVGSVLVDEIESSLRKFVRLDDIQEVYASLSDENSDDAEEYEELKPYGPELVAMSSEKLVLAPSPGEADPEAAQKLLFSEGTTQSAVPLVSAMKGTREKMGKTLTKLSVKWAPDVYDPIPNSLSHTVKSKQKKSRKDKDNNSYKKNGKKGQKGNSKGASSKDKKQLRKTGGRSEKVYRTMSTYDGLDSSSDGFFVGSPDYCGSSFLKRSPSNFHYSVAEAL